MIFIIVIPRWGKLYHYHKPEDIMPLLQVSGIFPLFADIVVILQARGVFPYYRSEGCFIITGQGNLFYYRSGEIVLLLQVSGLFFSQVSGNCFTIWGYYSGQRIVTFLQVRRLFYYYRSGEIVLLLQVRGLFIITGQGETVPISHVREKSYLSKNSWDTLPLSQVMGNCTTNYHRSGNIMPLAQVRRKYLPQFKEDYTTITRQRKLVPYHKPIDITPMLNLKGSEAGSVMKVGTGKGVALGLQKAE